MVQAVYLTIIVFTLHAIKSCPQSSDASTIICKLIDRNFISQKTFPLFEISSTNFQQIYLVEQLSRKIFNVKT